MKNFYKIILLLLSILTQSLSLHAQTLVSNPSLVGKQVDLWRKKHPRQEALTILSYNILRGMERDTSQGKNIYTDWLEKKDIDILVIQETAKTTEQDLATLAKNYHHKYITLLKENSYSLAITSKYPIEQIKKQTQGMHHGFISCYIHGYRLLNTHLSPFSYEKRRVEMDTILKEIGSGNSQEKWIVLGDFNSISPLDSALYLNSDSYLNNMKNLAKKYSSHDNLIDGDKLDFEVHQKILHADWVDALHAFNSKYIITRPARIDFIYLSNDLKNKILDAKIVIDDFTKKYSDHYPIYLALDTNN